MGEKDIRNLSDLVKFGNGAKSVSATVGKKAFWVILTQLKGAKGLYIDTSRWTDIQIEYNGIKYRVREDPKRA